MWRRSTSGIASIPLFACCCRRFSLAPRRWCEEQQLGRVALRNLPVATLSLLAAGGLDISGQGG